MKQQVTLGKHVSMIVLTVVLTTIIGFFTTRLISYPDAQASAVSSLGNRVSIVETKQSSDEQDSQEFQQQVLAGLAAVNAKLDTQGQNIFDMARAYGIPNPKQ